MCDGFFWEGYFFKKKSEKRKRSVSKMATTPTKEKKTTPTYEKSRPAGLPSASVRQSFGFCISNRRVLSLESNFNFFFHYTPQLAFLTRENFRQTSPVHVRRSSLGSSSNTPEKSLYNKLHEDPKVKAAQYSGVRFRAFSFSVHIFLILTHTSHYLTHITTVQSPRSSNKCHCLW